MKTLPNPRDISNIVGAQEGPFTPNKHGLSILFTIWGQFLDHDITMTPEQEEEEGHSIEKMDIDIPKGDAHMDKHNTGKERMNFKRSFYTRDISGVRNQMNGITAWVDASNVYGSGKETADSIRTF